MKLWDIVKTVGSAAIQTALPGTGSLIVGAVNALLPADKQLPESATGEQLSSAISKMPPEEQAAIMEKKYDVDIEEIRQSHATVQAMLKSDAENPHSTRPYIAKGSFLVLAFTIIVIVSTWSYGVLSANHEIVRSIMNGWPFILAVIGPLIALLKAYFGILRQEHQTKLEAAGGAISPSGIAGAISSILGKRKL